MIKKNIHVMYATVIILILLISSVIAPSALADNKNIGEKGFNRGVSWAPIVPMKRLTFIGYDDDSIIDDLAYLSSVPSSVFYDNENKILYNNPLLFYEDEHVVEEDKERIFNTRQGIDYFMEDWVSYCNGYMDQVTLVNVPKEKMKEEWRANKISLIESDNIYEIAKEIALHDWSFCKNAVVAVVNNQYNKPMNQTRGEVKGVLEKKEIDRKHFEVPKTNQVYPIYHEFNVPEGYKLLKIRSWYPSFYIDAGLPGGFESIVNISIPAGDRDMQVYCDYNGEWMMAGITNAWNAQGGMDRDKTTVYVYKSGRWSVAITDVPTKSYNPGSLSLFDNKDSDMEPQRHHRILSIGFGRYGSIIDILRNIRKVTYNVDVEMYPGVLVEIPDTPIYGCRNAHFKLSWDDPSVALGFSLIGPSGEEILSTRESGVSSKCTIPSDPNEMAMPTGSENELYVERLGECLPGEHYSVCVYAQSEMTSSPSFTITYNWEQNISEDEGYGLTSATEGAVIASLLNTLLLYTSESSIPSDTIEALYTLGVKDIILVDIGARLSNNAKNKLNQMFKVEHITTMEAAYKRILDKTNSRSIVFSTIDPWSYWYATELGVAGEKKHSLSIGPAAYIAAHHGCPVMVVDNHPELSSAVVWHNELWRRHPDGHSKLPMVSEMYLTGRRVYNLLKKLGLDKEGEESIITVADQFDIGLSWDRVFVGKAKPGRFIGSPVDLSVWINRNVFYPMIIFENPALKNPSGVKLINGSSSKRGGLLGLLTLWRGGLGLKITKPSQEEVFKYPVLDTLICYLHKFNTRASKYWGFTYTCADGTIPGVSQSFDPIDEGVMEAVNGAKGAFFADMSGSEVQPFYLRRAGYTPVFSTSFEANMENLNRGVLLWMVNTHGGPLDGGLLMFWDVENKNPRGYPAIPLAGYKKEVNPWRAYEWLMGSTSEPDTMTSEIHGLLAALAGNPNPKGPRLMSTALDWALAKRPLRDAIGRIASLPVIRLFTPEWLKDTQDYYDGVIITVFLGRFGTSWYTGIDIDDNLSNIHSVGVSSVACLPAGKYLHLALMRHGSVFQIMDPWATSWYSDVWQNMVPRGLALGKTIGEIYNEGIKKVGIQYISEPPNWWWDLAENVCLYGDPDLRIWVPSTEYSSMNYWSKSDVGSLVYDPDVGFMVDGHAPFGALEYPYSRGKPTILEENALYIVLGVLIVLFIMLIVAISWGRKKRE